MAGLWPSTNAAGLPAASVAASIAASIAASLAHDHDHCLTHVVVFRIDIRCLWNIFAKSVSKCQGRRASMKVVGTAVEGAKGNLEEIALLFAEAAQHQAQIIVTARSLDRSIEVAAATKATAEAQCSNAARAVESNKGEWASTHAIIGPCAQNEGKNKAIGIGIIVVSVLAAFAFPPLLLLAVGGGYWLWNSNKKRDEEAAAKARTLEAIESAGAQLGAVLAEANTQLAAAAQGLTTLQAQRGNLVQAKVLKAVGRVYLPFLPFDLAGYPVVIDGTGTTATTTLTLPDLGANEAELARVQETIDAAKAPPIFLRPAGEHVSSVAHIHGEEGDLAVAIDTFGEILESVPVFTAAVPLVLADTPLMRALQGVAHPKEAPGAVIRGATEQTRDALAQVTRYTQNMRGDGKDIEKTFRTMRNELREVLVRYGSMRTEAVEQAHLSLTEVLKHSDYAHVTYYCPRCNRVPQYMFQQLGVELETAHEANPTDLLNALQENDDARQRIVADEGLLGEFSNALQGISEVDAAIAGWEAQHAAGNALVGSQSILGANVSETRLRALRSQKKQLLGQFRGLLRKIVTGNARPILELSRQARLTLDPDTGEWDCPLCELHLDDQESARMGRLLKIKDELLMPMWNALWTEKDDFRKSELFRTNEQIQRLVEKEVGALRDVAEQYRADMRPVRENLVIASTEALAARDQLESAIGSLSALGVISTQRSQETLGRLGSMTGGDLSKLKKRAESKESILNTEPNAQMARRIMAIDPIGQLMSPEQLFTETAGAAERTTLQSDTEARHG